MHRLFAVLLTVTMHALAAAGPSFLPYGARATFLDDLPYNDRVELLALLEAPEENAQRLLASEDPIDRGLGIFTAAFSADMDRLLAARDLLFDERETVPTGVVLNAVPVWNPIVIDGKTYNDPIPQQGPQTVRRYLRRMYAGVFGSGGQLLGTDWRDIHALAERVEREGSVWTYAGAWTHRYMVALEQAERDAALEGIRQLPEPLRVAVVHEITDRGGNVIDDEAMQEIVRSVSDETKRKIREGTLEMPPDLKYRDPEGTATKGLRQRARYLLDGVYEPE